MASGPSSFNLFNLFLLLLLAAGGYAAWKLGPIYLTAWQVDQPPNAAAPISSAALIPSPVLCRVPRTLAISQPGP